MKKNILELKDVEQIAQNEVQKKIVLVGGCFDLWHYGHYTFLKNARSHGDVLVVALESDKFIDKRKKRIAVHSQQQRAEILASMEFVDYVVMLPYMESDEDYFQLVQKVKPAIIAVTASDPYIHQKEQHAQKVNAEIVVVTDLLSGFSSGSIIKKLSE